jgi:carbonic anhydrase/acetyltransferase-like protein (isoleucine patch superfamily)
MIHELKGKKPAIAGGTFIAPSADVIGDVNIEPGTL